MTKFLQVVCTTNEPSWVASWLPPTNPSAIFNLGKMSITAEWTKISAPNYMAGCITAMRRWPRDHKSQSEVNSPSNEYRKQQGVDLSDYNRYLNQIWCRAEAPLYKHDEMCQIHIAWKSIFNFGKMSITLHCIKMSAPDFLGRCIMPFTAMQRWPRDQKSKPEVNSRDVIK